jgi:site-specific recombinase XerD
MKAEMSLSLFINPKEWDYQLKRFLDTSELNASLNNRLSEIEGKLMACYEILVRDHTFVTPVMVRELYQGKTITSNIKLLDFFEEYINEMKSKHGVYRFATVQNYQGTRNYLRRFLEEKKISHLMIKDFSKKHLMEFETYLLTRFVIQSKQLMKKNTSSKHLKKFKTVINNARSKGIIQVDPYANFKICHERPNKIYLTKEEIQLIKNLSLEGNSLLQIARDIFLFSIYTGLRYSDAINLTAAKLTQGDDQSYWIEAYQHKTSEPIEIPLLDPAVAIVERYKKLQEETGFVLPRMSNFKLNCRLKDIAKLSGVNKYISHHVARHTFATTIMIEEGIDIKTVSRMLGHSSLRSTESYAKITRKHLWNVAKHLNKIV